MTLLLVVMLNYAYVNLKQTSNEIDVYKDMPETIQVCNVGSSHGKNSFNYSEWKEKLGCFNFALTSQRFQYDYRLLYNYSDRLEEGAVVFIPFSYFSLWGENDEERFDFESMNNRYYSILPPELIIRYDPWVDVCQHYLPILSAYDDVIDVFKDTAFGNGDSQSFGDNTINYETDVLTQYNGQIMGNRDENGRLMLNEERVEALYDIINLCKEKKVRPILITTPLTKLFTDYVDENNPEFLEEFYQTIEAICDDMGVEYYDYSRDLRICDNLDYFIDAHHLNEQGAVVFTNIVMKEIVSKYYDIK